MLANDVVVEHSFFALCGLHECLEKDTSLTSNTKKEEVTLALFAQLSELLHRPPMKVSLYRPKSTYIEMMQSGINFQMQSILLNGFSRPYLD